ncbi:MAG TPA: UDP-N-acetylmuramoyl-L-alanyl-D-glutamate--2,6-diaminopimelate ligase [Pyrinomonadaceae bacterium]|jgi:UDP-N-acetylmuramyl-tripeptide synthetase|nr:UDP-N-acetylmuramoyl-L-alanyl-D-glutamate--2,6-diaminopimelate ligase [Pyrinomonadaceae bacterium]
MRRDDTGGRAVTLADVAGATGAELSGDGAAEVADVTHDSRQARAGSLFVAIRGERFDAHEFVPRVMGQGAVGVLSERDRPAGFQGAWLRVADARRALAFAAAEVHGHPSRGLKLVAITGTNGKTTTAHIVASIVEAAGDKVAVLGTVGYRIGTEHFDAPHTTPEASDVQRFLRRAVGAGTSAAVMESSSQALDLHRCDALKVAAAVFTNLTQDHLDYHGTMENYFDAKLRLFDGRTGERPAASVVNLDDEYGARLARELEGAGSRVVTYAIRAGADVSARGVEFSLGGNRFEMRTPGGALAVRSPLVGQPHVYNVLAATAAALALGYGSDVIARAVEHCAGAPGRFERVAHAGDFAVIVDYAHTDDALRNVLRTARDVAAEGARVITVFGCGGDRDRTKRAPMGEAAAGLSDVVVLTSDNPRTEDPEAILRDAEVGLKRVGKPYLKLTDRREAIRRAIGEAHSGDVVVIAGKGHETYQIVGDETLHFDDREVARESLASRGLA